ncbi:hypothetical protein, partial [Vacuolonema iberomarrocanum]|uniref:hypothetical protein n=1 Tax=Vacuolonema iberomarrocanum TaxID=3454632 RepID=UPI003F6DEC63
AMNPCNSSTAVWEEVLTTEVTWIRLDLCIFPYSLQKSKRIAIARHDEKPDLKNLHRSQRERCRFFWIFGLIAPTDLHR